jgi:hypothetical protein
MDFLTHGIGWALSILAAGFFGGYLHAYMSKKGEFRAETENLPKAVEHTEKTTEAVEAVRAKFGDKSHAKQRRDDKRLDTSMEIMQLFGTMKQVALDYFVGIVAMNRLQFMVDPPEVLRNSAIEQSESAMQRSQALLVQLWQLEETTKLIFSEEVHKKLGAVAHAFNQIRAEVYKDSRNFDPLLKTLAERQEEVSKVIKEELHF